jgi:hypothetical protein
MNPLSVTANEAKMLKHLPWMSEIQAGQPRPVLLVICPTNKCQVNCPHCCFKDRDRDLELPLNVLLDAVTDLESLGLESVEFAGGGDPTLYSGLVDALSLCQILTLPVGINTNGIHIDSIPWKLFRWVRFNSNILDMPKFRSLWLEHAEIVRKLTTLTSCYIVRENTEFKQLERAVRWAEETDTYLRVAPDCILSVDRIERLLLDTAHSLRVIIGNHSKNVFLSDFNTWTKPRGNNHCYMHMMKPCLSSDGWMYACPSSELAIENGADLAPEFRLCRAEDVKTYYQNVAVAPRHHDCSFCKYNSQNKMMEALIANTEFNEFI